MSRRLAVNPVLSRELRQRVRGRRASVVLTAYLTLLVVAVGLLIWGVEQSQSSFSTATQGVGRTLFGTLLFGILGLVCFIVPGVAAGAVAGERERLTLVPLQVTLLTPGQVLRGKLLASLAFTSLLLVATLPLLAVAYVLGGVTVPQIAGGLFFVLASAAFLGVVSIWASTLLRRVQRATVVSYGLVGLLVLGTPILYGVQVVATSRTRFSGDGPTRDKRVESLILLAANPFLVTADALGHTTDGGGASPFTPPQEALKRRDQRRRGLAQDGAFQGENRFASGVAAPATTIPPFAVNTGPILPTATTSAAPFSQSGPTTTFIAQQPGGVPVPVPLTNPILPERFSGNVDGVVGQVFVPVRDHGDFTDRGPIWAWTFGWWIVVGGAAYLHAGRRLRLPSVAGVRP